MKILVTGATGLLGSYVVKELSAIRGCSIYGIDREKHRESNVVSCAYGDIERKETYDSLPERFDVCIHTAAAIPASESPDDQESCISTNICGTFQLVKFLLRRSPQARLIFTSTLSVYKPGSGVRHENSPALPETFYGLSKLYGERTVLHSGLQTAVFRLTSFYDSHWEARIHQRLLYDWIEKAIRGEDLVVWGSGAERRNYLHIQDVASAIRRCVLEWASGIYNIASPDSTTLLEIAETVVNVTGSGSRIIHDPSRSVYTPPQKIDTGRARRILGFVPTISLTEGISSIVRHAS